MSNKVRLYKRKVIREPVMGFYWMLQYGGEESMALQWYSKALGVDTPENDDEANSGCFACNMSIPFSGLIWVCKDGGPSTVVHEISHAVMHVCRVLELNPVEADEFQASYQGYLMRQFAKLL